MSTTSFSEKALTLIERCHPGTFSTKKFTTLNALEKAQALYNLVYSSRFELISHFIFGPFSNYIKSGEEFIDGLEYGCGGVCLERVLGLKLLLETFEVGDCSYLMGGSLPGVNQPMNINEVKESLKSANRMQHSIYAHHAALLLKINGKEWLLDPNAGRLGKIFLNPPLTEAMLDNDPSKKFGMQASFGQMFYHRAPPELLGAMVEANRADKYNALDLICLMGLFVGKNFDIFLIPKSELDERMPKLFPRRVQTMCWEVQGNILDILRQHNLSIDRWSNDRFIEMLNAGYAKLCEVSLKPQGKGELQTVLRIAERPWSDFTEPGPPLPQEFLMR